MTYYYLPLIYEGSNIRKLIFKICRKFQHLNFEQVLWPIGTFYQDETYTIVSDLSKLKFTWFVCGSTIITKKVMNENVEGGVRCTPPRYC